MSSLTLSSLYGIKAYITQHAGAFSPLWTSIPRGYFSLRLFVDGRSHTAEINKGEDGGITTNLDTPGGGNLENNEYYTILGLERGAGSKEIRLAYRELALKYHPDRNRNDAAAAEKMKKINEAYAVLSDPEKKKDYDALHQQYGRSAHTQFRQSYSDKDIFEGSDIHHVFEDISRSFGLRGFEDIFREFYGPGYKKRFKFTGPGLFGAGFIFFGVLGKGRHGRLPLLMPGMGRLAGAFLNKLTDSRTARRGKHTYDVINIGPDLARAGGPFAYYHRKRNKKLVVKIPPNIKNGQRIRLSGMGNDGKGGGEPGDLYLRVNVHTPLIEKTKNLLSNMFKIK